MKDTKASMAVFMEYFPEIIPPLTVTNEAIKDISKNNKTLPGVFIQEYFQSWHGELDEFTEYIPCFSLEEEEKFYAIVYWKGSLLSHEFYLATIDKRTQKLINKKVIAGTISDGIKVIDCVAKIEEDKSVHVMIGEKTEKEFNPLESKAIYMEILPDGTIESFKEDNPISWLKEDINQKK